MSAKDKFTKFLKSLVDYHTLAQLGTVWFFVNYAGPVRDMMDKVLGVVITNPRTETQIAGLGMIYFGLLLGHWVGTELLGLMPPK